MFIFGHIGIGRGLARPWHARLPPLALLLGTILPDLIDKPLYYARLWPIVSSTRTFGHTGLLLLLLCVVAYLRRSAAVAAVGVGVATHLLLDLVTEVFGPDGPHSTWMAITWPFMGSHFATFYLASVTRHLEVLWKGPVIVGEVVGLGLIGWELWERRRRAKARLASSGVSGRA